MFTLLGTIISGVLGGGATGLLGVLIQRWFDLKNRDRDLEVLRMNLQNSIQLAQLESERARMRADADERIADRDAEARENEADSKSMVASYEHDRAAYLDKSAQRRKGFLGGLITLMMAFVDFTRGILRPGLTIYLTAIVTVMFLQIRAMLELKGIEMTSEQLLTLLAQIIATILYCFSACVLWWFGTRPPKKGGDR